MRVIPIAALLFLSGPFFVLASSVSVTPVLIDLTVEGRDSVTREISVTNISDSKIDVYATVNEVSVTDGSVKQFVEPGNTDRAATITSWVEITRARIELMPGQTEVVPLTINVHPKALPGEYHMQVGFLSASKRHEAEAAAMSGRVEGTLVKVTVDQQKNELLRINSFLIDRFIISDTDRQISINLENNGDTPAVPDGEIIFYNSRGEEVSALTLGTVSEAIPAGETRSVTTEVPFDDTFGRYKANLVFRYGDSQQAAVFDTVQFYMIPFPLLVVFLVAVIVLSFLITYLIRTTSDHERADDEDGTTVPLYIRNDREHKEKDHDITLTKQ